jgi:hypothetical protein
LARRPVLLVTLLLASTLLIPAVRADLSVQVVNDLYVFPPSEFEGTVAYPDILIIKGESLEVALLPNRGITLWRLKSTLTGNENLYSNPTPIPYRDELTGKFYVEFGGYYALYPWNKRDNQPYIKGYEVVKQTPQLVEVHTWAEDIETGVRLEERLTFREGSTAVEMQLNITNTTTKPLTFRFTDRLVATPGGGFTPETEFLIPTDTIQVVQSRNNWMGSPGQTLDWPQPWALWREFTDIGAYESGLLTAPYYALINHRTGDVLVKVWDPADFFERVRVRSWGPNYEEAQFKRPVAYLEGISKEINLLPGESTLFNITLYLLKGLDRLVAVSKAGAGYLEPAKDSYEPGEVVELTLRLALNTITADTTYTVGLLDKEGNLIKNIGEYGLEGIKPSETLIKTLSFKNEGIETGDYIIQLVVSTPQKQLLLLKTPIHLEGAVTAPLLTYIPVIIAAAAIFIAIIWYKRR